VTKSYKQNLGKDHLTKQVKFDIMRLIIVTIELI